MKVTSLRPLLSLCASASLACAAAACSHGHETPAQTRPLVPVFAHTFDVSHFLKGNIHTHTTQSDGDSSPRDVITAYRMLGYNFLAITDHNSITSPADYLDVEEPDFVLLSGEEITMIGGGKPVHVNGLCVKRTIPGYVFDTPLQALDYAVSAIKLQHGVALINHPNYGNALALDDIVQAKAPLVEIASGHPFVYPSGSSNRPSVEKLWEEALDTGEHIMAAGVDDMHSLATCRDPMAYPGQVWVETFGDQVYARTICQSLTAGDLYVSNGPSIERLKVEPGDYGVWPGFDGAMVDFIGRGGEVITRVGPLEAGGSAHASPTAAMTYLRAVVTDRTGHRAWTPPVFVTNGHPEPSPSGAL